MKNENEMFETIMVLFLIAFIIGCFFGVGLHILILNL